MTSELVSCDSCHWSNCVRERVCVHEPTATSRKTLGVKTCMQGQKSHKSSRRQGTLPVMCHTFPVLLIHKIWNVKGGETFNRLKLYNPPGCPIKAAHTQRRAQGRVIHAVCSSIKIQEDRAEST